MKHLYTYGLSLIVASSMAIATSISTTASGYKLTSNIALNVEGSLSGDHDWVGIYKKGSTNDWNNVLGWSWVEHPTEGLSIDTIIDNGGYSGRNILLDGGDFEARLFFHNSYHAEASTSFYMTRADKPDLLIVNPMYQVGDTPQVSVNTVLSGDQDWVGIYPINSDNSWSNVIAWNWVKSNGIVDINKLRPGKTLSAGDYEARLFFHNSYTVEASSNFNVEATQSAIRTTKDTYTVNELVAINISTALSGDQDWVGIFPKDSDNSWGNVLGWNWVENGSNILDKDVDLLPAGEYEIRLFFHNEYGANAEERASYGFKVVGNNAKNTYGEPGPYINEVNKNPEEHGDYFVYYPKNHVQGAPLVLVSGYTGVHGYSGLMKYLASKGCYVVGHRDRKDADGKWYNPEPRIVWFEKAVVDAVGKGVDTSRLATMGSSAGGMVSYKIMEHFKNKGLGTAKSFIIDIQGWDASSMRKEALNRLDIDASLIFQVGGDTSIQDKYSQDPRTLITVSKLLNQAVKKSFIVLKTIHHSYASGTYDKILKKHTLIDPIDKMLKYEFFNSDGRYNEVENDLFNVNTYNDTLQRVYNATIDYLEGDTRRAKSRSKYGWLRCPDSAGIDYCKDHGLHYIK